MCPQNQLNVVSLYVVSTHLDGGCAAYCPEPACAFDRDDLGDDIFVEVKASALRGKNIFNMSLPEMKFAEAQGNNLHIYRVAGVGTDNPSLTRLINPIQLTKMKLINLCVQM